MRRSTNAVAASLLACALITLGAGTATAATDDPLPGETPTCFTFAPTDEPTTDVIDEPTTDVIDEPTTDVIDEPTTDVTDEPTTDVTDEPTVEATEGWACVLGEKIPVVEVNDDGMLPPTGAHSETVMAGVIMLLVGALAVAFSRRPDGSH